MGSVSVDLKKSERQLEVMFPMNTVEGVETFLENLPYIEESMYLHADTDALILIIDFQKAVDDTALSARERTAIYKVFVQDVKRVDVAKYYGVTKQTVQKWIERALQKLASYYDESGDYDVN